LREYSRPLTAEVTGVGNLADDVVTRATEDAGAVMFGVRQGSTWRDVTAGSFLDQVRGVARGLCASGIRPGDRVGLLSRSRYEWTLLDYAIWYAGAASVPLYETSSAEQVEWILRDCGARALVVETADHAARVAGLRGSLESLDDVWCLDDGAVEALVAAGRDWSADDLEDRRRSVRADSLATIIYTSGTTGTPKGCVLTHGNFGFELAVVTAELDDLFSGEDAATLLVLPLAHVLARLVQVGAVRARVRLGYCPDVRSLTRDLEQFRPTFVLAVPRVFEKIFNRASQEAAADGRSRTFDRAAETAIAYSRALDGRRVGRVLRLRHALFDRLVYTRLREALGGRCGYAVSGGAPLGERLGHFYRGIGVTILEGYGLTETTGAATVNRPGALKVGTVGRPLGGTAVRVAEDGELHVRGGQVFGSYWANDAATVAALDGAGWLRTGDVGEIDDEGFVRVTGRKKEILVTTGGKNVAPTVLEDGIRAHPLVSQCMVVGDGRPFIAALVTLDAEALEAWAAERGLPTSPAALADAPALRAEIQSAVDEANKAVSQAEAVRAFRVLPVDWTEDRDELTPSLKVKRNMVTARFRREIDGLYPR
jgi:long-chain acyl-CoA synthetase